MVLTLYLWGSRGAFSVEKQRRNSIRIGSLNLELFGDSGYPKDYDYSEEYDYYLEDPEDSENFELIAGHQHKCNKLKRDPCRASEKCTWIRNRRECRRVRRTS